MRRNTTYYEYQRIARALGVRIFWLLHHPERHAYRTDRIRSSARGPALRRIMEHETRRVELLCRAAEEGIPLPPAMARRWQGEKRVRRGWGYDEGPDRHAMPGRWY